MKKLLLTAVLICITTYACQDFCNWTDFLGDPQRTAYTGCAGPDTPVELWKVEMPGDFDTPPFIVGDTVLVLWKDSAYHPGKSKVIQLDLLTGKVLHQIETDELFFKIFPVDDQVFGASGLELYIIDLESGESTFLASFSGKTFGGTLKYPVVLEDRIIFPTTPVVCLSRSDFSTLWNLNQSTSEKDTAPIHLAGDETMVVSLMYSEKGNQIIAVNPETGSLTWKSKPFFAGWLALGSNAVYCGGECLRAFDRRGSKLWEVTPEETIVSNIVVGPDALYFADAANNLYRIGGDGNLIWKTKWEGDIMCTERGSILCCDIYLVGAGDILYCVGSFMDRGSQITAYRMEDGSILWTFHFEISDSMSVPPFGQIVAPPAVAEGVLVLGTMTGEVMAFASDPDLFVRQGDAFSSDGHTERAVNSYKQAAELYEKRGDVSESHRILERICELENPSESSSPDTSPESSSPSMPPDATSAVMPQSTFPESPLPGSNVSVLQVVVLAIAAIGISAYYLINRRKAK